MELIGDDGSWSKKDERSMKVVGGWWMLVEERMMMVHDT